jgi:hypothetical protein
VKFDKNYYPIIFAEFYDLFELHVTTQPMGGGGVQANQLYSKYISRKIEVEEVSYAT